EGPFFADLFEAHDVREVIDVGAGSGKHAIMFARWGKRVVAADPDESMLAQARANLGEAEDDIAASGGDLKIVEAGFGHLALHDLGPVDAITCTGNALPHVAGHDGLAAALRDFHAVLRPGGVVVLHLLNHQRLLDNRVRSIPPVVRVAEDGTMTVFLRVIDYPEGGEYIDFDFLTLTRPPGGAWQTASRRSAHTALPIATLTTALQQAGFGDVRAYGSHDGTPLEIDADESVVVTAERL
ncbi:MAG: class I SAM-dependent methyltransferase, partial [Actinobacteria bacterium]